jgi:hypothetical protein
MSSRILDLVADLGYNPASALPTATRRRDHRGVRARRRPRRSGSGRGVAGASIDAPRAVGRSGIRSFGG